METTKAPPCPFCSKNSQQIEMENGTAFAIQDSAPVSKYHMLIMPKRHCRNYFEMNPAERSDCHDLIIKLKNEIKSKDPEVSGFNIGINCGESAGQTIFHAHIHLIPRRKADTPNPRGGVRGVIPGRMDY